MTQSMLHQIVVGATPQDAITDHALLIQSWLRDSGRRSEIYAYHIHPELEKDILPLAAYRPERGEQLVIFHHSIGSPAVDMVAAQPVRLIVIYHNITPPQFFAQTDPAWANMMRQGIEQLHLLRPQTDLGLGVSAFNQQDLINVGYAPTGVLPITFDPKEYDVPNNPQIEAAKRGRKQLLFVGRIAPNKRQEDLIHLLYLLRKLRQDVELVLVGKLWLDKYVLWLQELTKILGVSDYVRMTGRVTMSDMATYYRTADLYVSMSEHEGFGKPFIEAMHFGLPIMAYAAAVTPFTLDGSGILFHQKNFAALAELIDIVLNDDVLLSRMVDRQRYRVADFAEVRVRQLFDDFLRQVGI